MGHTAAVGVRGRALMIAASVLVVVTGALAAARPALPAEVPLKNVQESCYIPLLNPLPAGVTVSPDEYCHDLYSQVTTTSIDGGVIVSWVPTNRHVYWYCGSSSKQDCPITEYRVTAFNEGKPATCSAGPGATSCTLTGLVNGLSQEIALSAFISTGNWFRVYMVAGACCGPPIPPTDATASVVQGNALDVQWTAPTNWGGANELTYEVTTVPPSAGCTTVALGCRVEDLEFGQSYTVTVRASNAAGPSQPAGTPGPYVIPTSVPAAPAITATTYGRGGTARVRWQPPTRDGGRPVTGYVVTASPGGANCQAKASARACVISGLKGGQSYSFTATAANALGRSASSPPAVAGRLVTAASKPRAVEATLSGTSAVVSWQPPVSNGGGRLVSYVVTSSPDAGTCSTKARQCTVRGLALGATYRFTVVAVNTAGRGVPSESASLTVPAPVAVAPTPAAPVEKPSAPLT